jgi:hypothetical protein
MAATLSRRGEVWALIPPCDAAAAAVLPCGAAAAPPREPLRGFDVFHVAFAAEEQAVLLRAPRPVFCAFSAAQQEAPPSPHV